MKALKRAFSQNVKTLVQPDGPKRMVSYSAVIVLLAIAAGFLVSFISFQETGLRLVIGVLAGTTLLIGGPFLCLLVVAMIGVVAPGPALFTIGEIDFGAMDLLYLPLTASLIASRKHRASASSSSAIRRLSPTSIAMFLGLIWLSLVKVAWVDPEFFPTALISALRLTLTFSFIWIVALTFTSYRQIKTSFGGVALAAIATIGSALFQVLNGGASWTTSRFGGWVNVNTLGLLAGLVILYGVFWANTAKVRFVLVVSGFVGLLLSKSVGGLVATVVAVIVGMHLSRVRKNRFGGLRLIPMFLVGILLAIAAIAWLRPIALPSSEEFRVSGTFHRLILGSAGLRLFWQNPVTGVGWQRSSSPAEIGNQQLGSELREQFPATNPEFFPDVNATSVHNAYIQILAEVGILGCIVFFWMIWRIWLGLKEMRGQLWIDQIEIRTFVLSCSALILILVWWNDNAIYGGQTETFLGSFFLGSLVAMSRIHRETMSHSNETETWPSDTNSEPRSAPV